MTLFLPDVEYSICTLCTVYTRWSGPISMSLFLPDVEYPIAMVFIKFLRTCYPSVRDQANQKIKYNRDGLPI